MDYELVTQQEEREQDAQSLQWQEVSSGVTQGLEMEPLLFNFFINHLEMGINSVVAMCTDDTTFFRLVKTNEDCDELQGIFYKLGEQA